MPAGIRLQVLNDYPVDTRDGFPAVALPDLPYGAEAWVLVALEVPAERPDGAVLLQVGVSGSDAQGAPLAFPEAALALPAMPASAWAMLLPDERVASRLAELEAGRLLEAARRAAANGDWAEIARLLAEAKTRFAGNPWVGEILAALEELAAQQDAMRFRKESLYSSSKLHQRLASKSEGLDLREDASAPSFVRRKPRQGKADRT